MAAKPVRPAEDAAVAALTVRAMRRSGWHYDGLALVSGFLSGVIVLRAGANVLMAVDIALRGGLVQVWQFVSAHVVILVLACVWTAVRRVSGIHDSLGEAPWLARFPRAARYVARCERRSVFRRAGFIVPVVSGVLMTGTAAALKPDIGMLFAVGGSLMVGTIVLSPLVGFFARKMVGDRQLLEVLQLLGLLVILSANPDIVPGSGGVAVVVFSRLVPADPVVVVGLSLLAGLSPLPACLVLRLVDRIGRITPVRVPRSALLVWYRRVAGGPWIIVFALMLPIMISGNIEDATRRWLSAIAAAGLLGWLVGVIGRMDQTLALQWNRPLARKSRLRMLVPMMGIHILLAAAATVPAIIR